MTDESRPNVSPTLLGFLQPLVAREGQLFGPLTAFLAQPSKAAVDEQRVRYLLADHAVRVCAAEALRFENCPSEADGLRALPPIEDRATATTAAEAVRAGHGLESAALAAQNATLLAGADAGPGFVGEQVAYTVLALADFYAKPTDRRRVFEAAIKLLMTLHMGSA